MVHHKAVRNYAHVDDLARVSQEILEGGIFFGLREKWALSRAAIAHVIQNASKCYSPMPRHSIWHRKESAVQRPTGSDPATVGAVRNETA